MTESEYIDNDRSVRGIAMAARRNTASACCASLLNDAVRPKEVDDLAHAFAALGDPVRLRLFNLIARAGESCSCELEAPLRKSQPTISHHTKILAEVGLITGEKRGRWMWWRVVPERVADLAAALELRAP